MLIKLKGQKELHIIAFILFSSQRHEELFDVIFDKQGTTQYSHDFNYRSVESKVMFNYGNKTIRNDGNMNLYSYSVFRISPKSFHSEMLFEEFEKQFYLPSVFIQKSNILSCKIEIVCVVSKCSLKFWSIIHNSSNLRWIIVFIPLACELYSLVTKDIIFSLKKVFTRDDVVLRFTLFSDNKECMRLLYFKKPVKVKIPSIKHIACQRLVSKPIHGVTVMNIGIGDSIEYRDLCNNINLGMNFNARLGTSQMSDILSYA